MSMEKVCPNCGSGTFISVEQITRPVIVNGEGEVLEAFPENKDGVLLNTLTCGCCDANLTVPQLVAEDYFHEVLALQTLEKVI